MNKINLRVRAIIEILGRPKDYVEKTLTAAIDRVSEYRGIKLIKAEKFEVKEVKNLFSVFAEIDIETETLEKLIDFCFDFMPSSVEILEPTNLIVEQNIVTDALNDLLARLHKFEMVLKNMKAEYLLLKKKLEEKN